MCSSSRLQAVLNKIRSILVANRYPNHIIFPRRSYNSTSHFNMDPKNAPFISIFHEWKMFQLNLKSKLLQLFSIATLLLKHVSAYHHHNVIYLFVCHCDSRYLGRTSQRFFRTHKATCFQVDQKPSFFPKSF